MEQTFGANRVNSVSVGSKLGTYKWEKTLFDSRQEQEVFFSRSVKTSC